MIYGAWITLKTSNTGLKFEEPITLFSGKIRGQHFGGEDGRARHGPGRKKRYKNREPPGRKKRQPSRRIRLFKKTEEESSKDTNKAIAPKKKNQTLQKNRRKKAPKTKKTESPPEEKNGQPSERRIRLFKKNRRKKALKTKKRTALKPLQRRPRKSKSPKPNPRKKPNKFSNSGKKNPKQMQEKIYKGKPHSWPKEVLIYTDGASRGNPGKASSALAVYDKKGTSLYEEAFSLGIKNQQFCGIFRRAQSLTLKRGNIRFKNSPLKATASFWLNNFPEFTK